MRNKTAQSITKIINRPFYQFLVILLIGAISLAAIIQLFQAVVLFKKIEREGVAGQVASILDTVYPSTDGVKLVSSLRNSIILSIISPSIVLFLFVIFIILSIDIKPDEEQQTQDHERRSRQGIMTALFTVGMATVGVVLTTLAVVKYNNALPIFEKTQEICRPLYELPECRSQLTNIRRFPVVLLFLLSTGLFTSLFHLYAVLQRSKLQKEKRTRREIRYAEQRLYNLPVVEYGDTPTTNRKTAV